MFGYELNPLENLELREVVGKRLRGSKMKYHLPILKMRPAGATGNLAIKSALSKLKMNPFHVGFEFDQI